MAVAEHKGFARPDEVRVFEKGRREPLREDVTEKIEAGDRLSPGGARA
jgi:hypothetical protein